MAANCGLAPTYGAGWQGFGSQGLIVPLNAGTIDTFLAGSSTPATTYVDFQGNTANANPIVLNSDGRPPQEIWLDITRSYKFVVKDSAGNVIETRDNLSASASVLGQIGANSGATVLPPSPWGNSLASPGYQKLPTGLILQWGATTPIASSGSQVITLPIAFPVGALVGFATIIGSAPGLFAVYGAIGLTSATQVTVYNFGTAGSAAFNWLVLGR